MSLKDDIYSFKHSFMFYYFVASYLKDNLYKDAEIREEIKHICQALYVEEYANILLFLAHLSKDPFIIEQLKNNAESIFENAPLAKLDNDIDFIGEINRKIKHITIPDIDKHQARQELLKKRDQDEEIDEAINRDLLRCDHPVERKQFVANPLLQLIASLKTLEILGQVLKNFPGSIEATEKLEITECCYKLGLRTLGFTFETLKGEEDALIETIMNVVREQYSDKHEQKAIDNETLKDMANKAIVGLTLSLSYSIIRRISLSVGTPELFTTYKKILDKLKHPSVKLIDCSLHLDQASHFPDKLIVNLAESFKSRWLPNDVLRRLVAQHLYLFDVPRDKKQRVCEKLKFDYTRVQAVDSKKKMIESKVKDTIQK